MKLEMSLPERPGFLHVLPVLDLFALLWLLFLLAPALLRQSGLGVELPPSRFQLERYDHSVVVTLGAGSEGPVFHFGREAVTRDDLHRRLEKLSEGGAAHSTMILLQSDRNTPVGLEREISEWVLQQGFRIALVGANESTPVQSTPSD